ncbi:hypothetical protein RND81_03G218700 [Saponaria officinalis]|uniref:Uncharacterized protein n=1 Tax=Saponaria officinalis TaxID=3572 RepID=A0AAW1M231_SAPOF
MFASFDRLYFFTFPFWVIFCSGIKNRNYPCISSPKKNRSKSKRKEMDESDRMINKKCFLQVLMGPIHNIRWYTITTLWFILLNTSYITTSSTPTNINPSFLDDYLYKHSSKSISKKIHTGVLLNITLPSNFSDIKVSIVRLRSGTMWVKGANYSTFDIPPRVITMPYVKRLAIMYDNFGNLSSNYYDLPGYEILSPIIGFAVYNATDLSGDTNPQRLNLTIAGEPIKVRFSDDQMKLSHDNNVMNMKCVRFDPIINRLVVLSDMISPNICLTRALGQFALAMPLINAPQPQPQPSPFPLLSKNRKRSVFAEMKWWLIGIGVGLLVLMMSIMGFVICYKAFRVRKILRMERKAEKSEALDTIWVRTSKMPSASVTRTRAMLENDFAP